VFVSEIALGSSSAAVAGWRRRLAYLAGSGDSRPASARGRGCLEVSGGAAIFSYKTRQAALATQIKLNRALEALLSSSGIGLIEYISLSTHVPRIDQFRAHMACMRVPRFRMPKFAASSREKKKINNTRIFKWP
jgi:hypothetical protein